MGCFIYPRAFGGLTWKKEDPPSDTTDTKVIHRQGKVASRVWDWSLTLRAGRVRWSPASSFAGTERVWTAHMWHQVLLEAPVRAKATLTTYDFLNGYGLTVELSRNGCGRNAQTFVETRQPTEMSQGLRDSDGHIKDFGGC